MHTYEHIYKITYLSLSFSLVFLSFSVAEVFATSLHNNGFVAIALLYICFAIFSPVAPLINNIIKTTQINLFLSSSIYIVWVIVSLHANDAVFLFISCLVGIAASSLWNQHGIYISKLALSTNDDSSMGFFMGLFFSIFGMNTIIGNIIGTAYLNSGGTIDNLFWIVTGIGIVGVISFLFLPNVEVENKSIVLDTIKTDGLVSDENNTTIINDKVKEDNLTIKEKLYDIWLLQQTSAMIYLTIFNVYFGFVTTYIFTVLPLVLSINDIPSVILSWSISSTIFPIFAGVIFSKFGPYAVLIIHLITLIIPHVFYAGDFERTFIIHLIMAFLIGVSDSFINTMANTSPGQYYKDRNAAAAFGLLRLCSSVGRAFLCLVGYFVTFQVMSITMLVICLPCSISFYFFLCIIEPSAEIEAVKSVDCDNSKSNNEIQIS